MDSFSYTYLKDSELLKLLLVLAGAAVAVFVVFRFIPSHSKKAEKKEKTDTFYCRSISDTHFAGSILCNE